MITLQWDKNCTQQGLHISDDGFVLSWMERNPARRDAWFGFQAIIGLFHRRSNILEAMGPAWLGAQATGQLSDGVFSWDFEIEALEKAQMGVGILLDPPDWGFFGYLGAGQGAWAYDPYKGAIVTQTRAIHSNLPKFKKKGTVSVELNLLDRRDFTFIVEGERTPSVEVPKDATVIPAACLLKLGQRVRLSNFRIRQ